MVNFGREMLKDGRLMICPDHDPGAAQTSQLLGLFVILARCQESPECGQSFQRPFLTVLLFPIPSDLTGDPRLEALQRRRQADGLHQIALSRTLAPFGLQLQQGCRTSTRGTASLTASHDER